MEVQVFKPGSSAAATGRLPAGIWCSISLQLLSLAGEAKGANLRSRGQAEESNLEVR